jgi:hypothetical protein
MRVGFGLCVQVCVYGTRLVSVREDCVCRPGVSMKILNVAPHQYFEHGVSPVPPREHEDLEPREVPKKREGTPRGCAARQSTRASYIPTARLSSIQDRAPWACRVRA